MCRVRVGGGPGHRAPPRDWNGGLLCKETKKSTHDPSVHFSPIVGDLTAAAGGVGGVLARGCAALEGVGCKTRR